MINDFVDWAQNQANVWIVNNKQLLDWVRNPVPVSQLNSIPSFQCALPVVTEKICNGMPSNEAGLLSSCPFSEFPFFTCVSLPHPLSWAHPLLLLSLCLCDAMYADSFGLFSTAVPRIHLRLLIQTRASRLSQDRCAHVCHPTARLLSGTLLAESACARTARRASLTTRRGLSGYVHFFEVSFSCVVLLTVRFPPTLPRFCYSLAQRCESYGWRHRQLAINTVLRTIWRWRRWWRRDARISGPRGPVVRCCAWLCGHGVWRGGHARGIRALVGRRVVSRVYTGSMQYK